MDSNQILHSSKYYQIFIVGGPVTWKTNQGDKRLPSEKLDKWHYLHNSLTNFDEIWQCDASEAPATRQ